MIIHALFCSTATSLGRVFLFRVDELSEFSIVGVSYAQHLWKEIIHPTYCGSRVNMDDRGVDCEHPATE